MMWGWACSGFDFCADLRVIYSALRSGGPRVRAEVSPAERRTAFGMFQSCEERSHQKRSRNENLWRYSV